jgi:WXXGXW repeat (2 copies)
MEMRHKILAAGLLATFVAACAPPPPPGVAYVRVAPPRARVEVIATSPGAGYVWIGGYHAWRGSEYVWVPGRWERPPQPHYRHWVAGHWREHHNGWYWVEGHWK